MGNPSLRLSEVLWIELLFLLVFFYSMVFWDFLNFFVEYILSIHFINVLRFYRCIRYLVFHKVFLSFIMAVIDYTYITSVGEYDKSIRLLL